MNSQRADSPVVSRLMLGLMTAYNAILFALCSCQILANIFVLKGGRFYSYQLYTSILISRWILFAPLFIPLWILILRRFGGMQFSIRYALIAVVLLISCLTNFPVAYGGLISGEVDALDLLLYMIRDGVTQPASFILASVGTAILFVPARWLKGLSETRISRIVTALFIAALLTKAVVAGPALPRLEDEVAYHIQSLIFESGSMKGELHSRPGLSLERLEDMTALPYLIHEGSSFYSAHMHGWSALLALLAQIHIKPFANLFLTALNFFLFCALASVYLGSDRTTSNYRTLAAALFATCPTLLFLSNTYMSHTLALTLGMTLMLMHTRIAADMKGITCAIIFCLVSVFAFYVRPQAVVPLFLAVGLHEFLNIIGIGTEARSQAIFRLTVVVAAGVCGVLFLHYYAQLYDPSAIVPMATYARQYFQEGCQSLGFGPGHGCFPTYGTMGHSFRKAVLNMVDIFSRWNQELSPGGIPLLPLASVLAFRNRRALIMNGPARICLTVIILAALQFGLYFHNGGESYRGRYLAESSFAMALLLTFLLMQELKDHKNAAGILEQGRVYVFAALVLLFPIMAALQIRGEYFHPVIEPFASVNSLRPGRIQGAVISARQASGEGEMTGVGGKVLNEFTGEIVVIPHDQVRRYLNLGYGTLAATSVRLNHEGIPEDADGNLLVADATLAEAQALRPGPVYTLEYRAFEPVTRTNRLLRFWKRPLPPVTEMKPK